MSTQEQGITIDGLPSLEQFSPEAMVYVVLNDQDYHIKFDVLRQFLVDNLPPAEIPEGLSTVEGMQVYVNNLFANKDFATTAQLQQAISGLAQPDMSGYVTREELNNLPGVSTKLGKIFFVNVNSNNPVENGSPEAPFKTIQAAIEAIPSASVIQLSPGAYREDVTFVRDNILIQGYGCVGSNIAEIIGTVTFGTETNTTISQCRLKDVTLRNTAVDNPVMDFKDNNGRHSFDNIVVEPMVGTTVPALNFEGETKNWVVFRDYAIGGLIKFSNPTETPLDVHFENGGHKNMEIYVDSDVRIKMKGTNKGKKITLWNGSIQASRISGFTGIDGVAIEINTMSYENNIIYSDFLNHEGGANSIWRVREGSHLLQAYNLFDTSLDQGDGAIEDIAGLSQEIQE